METRQPLTVREGDVMDRVVAGMTNKVIAKDLHVTTETVKSHLRRIYPKLGVVKRAAAAVAWEHRPTAVITGIRVRVGDSEEIWVVPGEGEVALS